MFRKVWLGLCLLAFAAMMFLLSSHANAETKAEALGLHIGSQHFPASSWNNVNPGVYLRIGVEGLSIPDGSYVVGTYFNSERRQSAYVGFIYPVTGSVDLIVGAITGYQRAAVLPMLVPSVHFPLVDNWSARVSFLPRVERSGSNVVHLSLERSF